jgi:hypothetical protein
MATALNTLSTRLGLGTAALLTGGVTLGFLPETKMGLRVAWNYPYSSIDEGTWAETGWRAVVAATGFSSGVAGMWAVNRRANFLVGVPLTLLYSFSGIVTAQLCYEYSGAVVWAGQKTTKLVTYSIDGFLADTVGRPENQPRRWEAEGLELDSLLEENERIMAANRQQRDPIAEKIASDLAGMKTPEMIEVGWAAGSLLETDEAKEKHKKLIILDLIRLREEERVATASLKDSQELLREARKTPLEQKVRHKIEALEAEIAEQKASKAKRKKQCLQVHGHSLSKLIMAEVSVAAVELTQLRREQLLLAKEFSFAKTPKEKSNAKIHIKRLDKKKKDLKKRIKDDFHYHLAYHDKAKRVASYRTYLRK